jgi:hypothetical protein
LRQFHAQHVTSYLRLLGQFLRVHVTEHGMVGTGMTRDKTRDQPGSRDFDHTPS